MSLTNMQRPLLQVNSSVPQLECKLEFMLPQSCSSSPPSQSCSLSHFQRLGIQVPSAHFNSPDVHWDGFWGQFSSSLQSPQSLSPSQRKRFRTHCPLGPPAPPNPPRHLNSPSGQLFITAGHLYSSELSLQSRSPSQRNAIETQYPSLHVKCSFEQLQVINIKFSLTRAQRGSTRRSERKAYLVRLQCPSSEKSLQSFSPSHNHCLGMQKPLEHSNWSSVQLMRSPQCVSSE